MTCQFILCNRCGACTQKIILAARPRLNAWCGSRRSTLGQVCQHAQPQRNANEIRKRQTIVLCFNQVRSADFTCRPKCFNVSQDVGVIPGLELEDDVKEPFCRRKLPLEDCFATSQEQWVHRGQFLKTSFERRCIVGRFVRPVQDKEPTSSRQLKAGRVNDFETT